MSLTREIPATKGPNSFRRMVRVKRRGFPKGISRRGRWIQRPCSRLGSGRGVGGRLPENTQTGLSDQLGDLRGCVLHEDPRGGPSASHRPASSGRQDVPGCDEISGRLSGARAMPASNRALEGISWGASRRSNGRTQRPRGLHQGEVLGGQTPRWWRCFPGEEDALESAQASWNAAETVATSLTLPGVGRLVVQGRHRSGEKQIVFRTQRLRGQRGGVSDKGLHLGPAPRRGRRESRNESQKLLHQCRGRIDGTVTVLEPAKWSPSGATAFHPEREAVDLRAARGALGDARFV